MKSKGITSLNLLSLPNRINSALFRFFTEYNELPEIDFVKLKLLHDSSTTSLEFHFKVAKSINLIYVYTLESEISFTSFMKYDVLLNVFYIAYLHYCKSYDLTPASIAEFEDVLSDDSMLKF